MSISSAFSHTRDAILEPAIGSTFSHTRDAIIESAIGSSFSHLRGTPVTSIILPTTGVTPTNPWTWGAGDAIDIIFNVPIISNSDNLVVHGGNLARDWEWKTFTPTGEWSANVTYSGVYRVIGDTLQQRVGVTVTGAVTGDGNFDLVSGFTIDSGKLISGAGDKQTVGLCTATRGGTNWYQFDVVASTAESTTKVYIIPQTIG